jgi:hypothetical protein
MFRLGEQAVRIYAIVPIHSNRTAHIAWVSCSTYMVSSTRYLLETQQSIASCMRDGSLASIPYMWLGAVGSAPG